ncbi:5-formyltetrahydrofolate cyclo-ligase [Paenibacillus sp. y28]|uniref:5-formyltetrahydrofolate cyclo-ligase n=1 Tax=Paenibacillus sp. y28 TaxID=3129110 RepID=UPI003016B956
MDIFQQKKNLRTELQSRRDSLAEAERQNSSLLICNRLQRLIGEQFPVDERLTIFAYWPFRSEADVRPFLHWCWTWGHRVLAPRTEKETRRMHLHRITGEHELVPGPWGLMEPGTDSPQLERDNDISLILIPGLAFTPQGARLGYGGGFYDTFFARLAAQNIPRPLTIAPAYELQLVSEVPVEPHDARVDYIVTERMTYTIPRGDGRV